MIHHGFEDAPKLAVDAKSEEKRLAIFRRVWDEIRSYIEQLPEILRAKTGRVENI